MSVCAICGRNAHARIEGAHTDHKGMGGRGEKAPDGWDTTHPLCAGTGGNTDPDSCHGAHHDGALELRDNPDGTLSYRANARYAALLRRRGVRAREGQWHVALNEDKDPDAIDVWGEDDTEAEASVGNAQYEAERVLEAYREQSARAWREAAEAVARVRDAAVQAHGKRAGGASAIEWAITGPGLSRTEAYRMLLVADTLPDLIGGVNTRGLPITQQYQLARACKQHPCQAAEYATLAATVSVSDFAAEVWPRAETERQPKACPHGLVCDR